VYLALMREVKHGVVTRTCVCLRVIQL